MCPLSPASLRPPCWPMHGVQVDLLPCRAPLASATTVPKSCSLWRKTVHGWRRQHPGLAEIEAHACGPRLTAAERQPREGSWAQHGPRASLSGGFLPAAARTPPCVEMYPVGKQIDLAPQSGRSGERCSVGSPAAALWTVLLSRMGREAGPDQRRPAGQQAAACGLTSRPGPSSPG